MATDDKVSVIVTSTDGSGTVKQKSFTYISPDATNAQLKTFAQAATALTNNRYDGSKKVTQVDLASATDKQTPTFSLTYTNGGSTVDLLNNPWNINVRATAAVLTYDGDGEVYLSIVQAPGTNSLTQYCAINQSEFNANHEAYIGAVFDSANTNTYTLKILIPETNTFKGVSAEVTISANVA